MSVRRCTRKGEVQLTLARGHWPAACADELREHVEQCVDCSLAVKLTQSMQVARASAHPSLPSAELVWWRAQLRKRQAAMQDVRKPMRRAQVFAVVLSFCVAVGLAAWLAISTGPGAWSSMHQSLNLWLTLGAASILLISGLTAFFLLDAD